MKRNVLSSSEKKEIHDDVLIAIDRAKKSKKNGITVISIVVILIVFIWGLYAFFHNNPKTIFENKVSYLFMNSSKYLNYDFEENKLSFVRGGNNLSMKYSKDNINYKVDGNIVNNDTLLGMNFYAVDNNLYFNADSVSSDYVLFDDNFYVFNNDDLKILLTSFNDALIKSLSDERFYGEKTQLNVNGKYIRVYLSSIKIGADDKNIIFNKILSNLREDKKFLSVAGKSSNIMKFVDVMRNFLPNKVNVYTKGINNEFVAMEFIDDDVYRFIKTKKGYDCYTNDKKSGFIIEDRNSLEISLNDFSFSKKRVSSFSKVSYNTKNDDNLKIMLGQYFDDNIYKKS